MLLTIPEAAKVLRVPTPRMYGLIRKHIIPCVALGRQRRVSPEVLDEFIKYGGKALAGGWKKQAEVR